MNARSVLLIARFVRMKIHVIFVLGYILSIPPLKSVMNVLMDLSQVKMFVLNVIISVNNAVIELINVLISQKMKF